MTRPSLVVASESWLVSRWRLSSPTGPFRIAARGPIAFLDMTTRVGRSTIVEKGHVERRYSTYHPSPTTSNGARGAI